MCLRPAQRVREAVTVVWGEKPPHRGCQALVWG